jgi:hypothetical protein
MRRRHPYSAYKDALRPELMADVSELSPEEALARYQDHARKQLGPFVHQVLAPHLPAVAPALTKAALGVLSSLRKPLHDEEERRHVAGEIMRRWRAIAPILDRESAQIEAALANHVLKRRLRTVSGR